MIAPTAVASLPAIPTPPAAMPAHAGAVSAFDALVQEFAGGAAPVIPQTPGFAQALPLAPATPKAVAVKVPAFINIVAGFKAPARKPVVVTAKASSSPVFRAPAQPVATLQPALSAVVPAPPVPVQAVVAQPVPLPAAPAIVSEPEAEISKAVAAKAGQEAPQEAPPVAIPVASAPVRRSGAAAPRVKSGGSAPVAVPVIAIAIPVLPPLPVLSTKPAPVQTSASSGEGGGSKPSATQTEDPKTPERLSTNDVALQVNIRMPNDANATAAGPEPAPIKQPLRAIAEMPVVATPVNAATAAVAPASVVQSQAAPATQSAPAQNVPAPRSAVPEEPVTKEPAATPIKSLSLEFTPDGAGDVRLRVTERAGEVHISLHSSDGSLGGKLHEGVQDLVGNLSKAGYDAEAWTPGQGHQGSQQQQEQRRQQQPKSGAAGTEEFGNIYEQQPGQEIS